MIFGRVCIQDIKQFICHFLIFKYQARRLDMIKYQIVNQSSGGGEGAARLKGSAVAGNLDANTYLLTIRLFEPQRPDPGTQIRKPN